MKIYTPSDKITPRMIVFILLFAIIGGVLAGTGIYLVTRIIEAHVTSTSRGVSIILLCAAIIMMMVGRALCTTWIKYGKVYIFGLSIAGGIICALSAIATALIRYFTSPNVSGHAGVGWLMASLFFFSLGALVFNVEARAPFCTRCVQWFGKKQQLGEFTFEDAKRLVPIFAAANLYRSEQLLQRKNNEATLVVFGTTCACPKPYHVITFATTFYPKGQTSGTHTTTTTPKLNLIVTAEESKEILNALNNIKANIEQ